MERTQTITGGVASFGNQTVSSAPGSGDTLATALTVTPTASIACGGLPMGSKCIFAPSSVNFSGSGNPMQVALTMEVGTLVEHSHWQPIQ